MTKTILIADDNANFCQTLKDILLEKGGYKIDTVDDGYKTLMYLRKNSPNVLILDLMMPFKDGLTIFSAIKNVAPKTKIIIYTAFKKYEDSAQAKSADRFLLKGGSLNELLEAIDELA